VIFSASWLKLGWTRSPRGAYARFALLISCFSSRYCVVQEDFSYALTIVDGSAWYIFWIHDDSRISFDDNFGMLSSDSGSCSTYSRRPLSARHQQIRRP
jgi:hypothetical protein